MQIEITDEEVKKLNDVFLFVGGILQKCFQQQELDFQLEICNMPTFGERLRLLREHYNYTKERVAINCDISVKTLTRYESNKTKPKTRNIIALSQFFRVKIDVLLGIETIGRDNGNE